MIEKIIEAPLTNRGAENTRKEHEYLDLQGEINDLNQFIIVDWFQATIFKQITYNNFGVVDYYFPEIKELFYNLFGIQAQDIVREEKGINGYTMRYSYKSIEMYTNPSRLDMGINIKLSGDGCRDVEQLNLSWYDLFQKIVDLESKINRVDIAIDDYTTNYFTLPKLQKMIRKGRVVSQFYKSLEIISRDLATGKSIGNTLQLGSKASRIQITFYDKLQERHAENVEISEHVITWTRCEVRFRHEHAIELIRRILSGESLNTIVKGILNYYIRFVDPPTSVDLNKSRWATSSWWLAYLENIEALKLSTLNPENSITRKKDWIDKSVSKSNLMVLMASLDLIRMDNLSSNYILELLQNGIKTIDLKDLQLINDYRIKSGLDRITMQELKDYVRDLKDVILIS